MAQTAVLKAQNRASHKGSDPRLATCRGKLQNKRSNLNHEIHRELRLRDGAENLFRATTNKKLKNNVALELSFVNSNLQLLMEQLFELNGNVEVYQGESPEPVMPMIPLGLKETKEIDFREAFKDFILEHYSEDGENYEKAILDFMDLRQAIRTPSRDNNGIRLFFHYYNQLHLVEKRFFPPERSLGIYFEWFDSLTGASSMQRTVAFEKACVLFNLAALYTQTGAKQNRFTDKGLDQAVVSYLRAAGTFAYIQENFTNPPSLDLAPHVTIMLRQLMLAQARECLFMKLELQSRSKRDVDVSLDLAQEAAQVAEVYAIAVHLITVSEVKNYVPCSWISLVQVKREHYAAIAHYHSAVGLLSKSLNELSEHTIQMLQLIHTRPVNKCYSTPINEEQRKQLGKAHLKSATLFHEEAHRILRMCRELRNKSLLVKVILGARERTINMYNNVDEEDDFNEIIDLPDIQPSSKFQLLLTPPDFAYFQTEDLFQSLGPLGIFSAKHHWTAPRIIQLQKDESSNSGFGFSIRGSAPVIIANVEPASTAYYAGVKQGDFIVSINDKDVKWAKHSELVKIIKDAGNNLTIRLVTPMDRNYLKPKDKSPNGSINGGGGTSSRSSAGSRHSPLSTRRKSPWNLFRRQKGKDKTRGGK